MNKCEPVETESPFFYSLLGAVNRFGIATNEIIDLAIKGEIILSVKVPKDCTSYLMSIIEPEIIKTFGLFMYTKKELEGTSMLPLESYATYLNLSRADCKVLRTSILEQSVFESVFFVPDVTNSEHRLMHFYNEWLSNLELHFYNDLSEVVRSNDYLSQQADNVPSIDRKRFINGVRAVESGEYLRRFVIVDKYLAHELDEDLEFDQGIQFQAGSYLNQTLSKQLKITQNDIEISSNYKKLLDSTSMPESSPYFVKPELREFNGLYALAEIGYKYFIVEENKGLNKLEKILSEYIQNVRTIECAAFFLNPDPSGNAEMHNETLTKSSKCQFQFLLYESEKYWIDKVECSTSAIRKYRIEFATELNKLGYAKEKALAGEYLSLPTKIRIKIELEAICKGKGKGKGKAKVKGGVKMLSVRAVFP